MSRGLAVVLLFVVVWLAAGCDRGAARPSAAGQPDYLNAALAAFANCQTAASTPDAGVAASGLRNGIARLTELRPPADLVKPQQNFVDAVRHADEALRAEADGRTVSPVSAQARQLRAMLDAARNWEHALSSHYGVTFFRNEGVSMEPTFRDGDALAVPPPSGPIQRWEVVVFKFPLDTSRMFVKRVVALPGESVAVRDGVVLIDGSPVQGDKYGLAQATYTYGPKDVPPNSYFVLGDNRNTSFDSHAWQAACSPRQVCDFVPRANIIGVLPASAHGPCTPGGR